MKNKVYTVIFLLGLMLLAAGEFSTGGVRHALRSQAVSYDRIKSSNSQKVDTAEINIEPNWLIGSEINVATTLQNERNPAVANCASGNFLVVYELNGDIWGQLLGGDGSLWGSSFVIYDGVNASYGPKVSCNYTADTFVVVWSYDYIGDNSDMDVLAQAVYGDYRGGASQLQGSRLFVSSDGVASEVYPSIACNYLDSSCLVVFQYSTTSENDIYARRLSSYGSGLSHDGDRFVVSNASGIIEFEPVIAWGEKQDEYMVAWLYTYAGVERVVYSMVYDTEQGDGASEIKSGTTWLINPGDYGGVFDQNNSYVDVDYNPNSGRYLVTYIENSTPKKVSPENGTSDVLVGVLTYPGRIYMDPTYLSYFVMGRPAVVANKISDSYKLINEFLLGYPYDYSQDNNNQVMGMIVPDRITTTNQRPVFSAKTAQKDSMLFDNIDVAMKYSNGRYLIVWEQTWASGDVDIVGQMISHGSYNFLPQVIGN
jgi:hypothetical protein